MVEKLTFANTQISVELDRKLREIAAKQRTSRSDIVRLAIESFIAQFDVVPVSTLPHPADAEPGPLVMVKPVEES